MRKKLCMHKQPLQTPTLKQLRMKTVHTLVYMPTIKKTSAYANTLITQHTPTIRKKSKKKNSVLRTRIRGGASALMAGRLVYVVYFDFF